MTPSYKDLDYKAVLGLNWDIYQDQLVFSFEKIVKGFSQLPLTKRNVLRVGGRFFDHSGVISPLVIQMKLIFQNLCESKTDSDDMVDVETVAKMNEFTRNLNEV